MLPQVDKEWQQLTWHLPGNFAFITAQPGASLTTSGVVISTMIPANPSLQNRRRQLINELSGTVTVEIS
jgi:hypothetical protein